MVDTGGPGGSPAGASLAAVDRAADRSPREVHLHWSPRSTTRVTGYGGPPGAGTGAARTNWIGYVEDPVSGAPRIDAQRVRLLTTSWSTTSGSPSTASPGTSVERSRRRRISAAPS